MFFLIFFKKKFLPKKRRRKKCCPLSFPILGGRDLTRALQSSPFQKYENLKIHFFFPPKKEEKNAILLVFQY